MSSLGKILAAHPLCGYTPYNAIKFAQIGPHGSPLYTVCGGKKHLGAPAALRTAFEKLGAHCFHCGVYMPAQKLSYECTRDHVRPLGGGGGDYLHNLVFACGKCNRGKSSSDLISFRPEAGSKYLKALDEHIVRCLRELKGK